MLVLDFSFCLIFSVIICAVNLSNLEPSPDLSDLNSVCLYENISLIDLAKRTIRMKLRRLYFLEDMLDEGTQYEINPKKLKEYQDNFRRRHNTIPLYEAALVVRLGWKDAFSPNQQWNNLNEKITQMRNKLLEESVIYLKEGSKSVTNRLELREMSQRARDLFANLIQVEDERYSLEIRLKKEFEATKQAQEQKNAEIWE